jgi:hypothetical protein
MESTGLQQKATVRFHGLSLTVPPSSPLLAPPSGDQCEISSSTQHPCSGPVTSAKVKRKGQKKKGGGGGDPPTYVGAYYLKLMASPTTCAADSVSVARTTCQAFRRPEGARRGTVQHRRCEADERMRPRLSIAADLSPMCADT